jgi:diadenosine tetraphosphate (Ap4A) HIT family hydrolase
MSSAFVNSDNTKNRPNRTYSKVIDQIVKDGVCPFCPDFLEKYHKKPILHDGEFWVLTENMYPYEGTSQHLLLIHKDHIQDFTEVSAKAWAELQTVVRKALEDRGIKGGTLLFRFGDTRFTGASVTHLHAQLTSGTGEKDASPVLARIG